MDNIRYILITTIKLSQEIKYDTYLKVRYRSRAFIFCLGTIGRRELPIRESSDSAPWPPLLSAFEWTLMLLGSVESRYETSSGAQFASMWMSIFKHVWMLYGVGM